MERYGIFPPSRSAAKNIVDQDLTSSTRKLFESGVMFRLRVVDLFLHARNYFANFGIQILRSNDGAQFLIGDVPSLTIGQDGKNVGLSGGVPLYDAQTLIMPFGPRFAVSLTKQNEWVDVGVEEVNWVNQIQLSAAHEHVYFHVESGLENLAQEVRPAKNLRVSSP